MILFVIITGEMQDAMHQQKIQNHRQGDMMPPSHGFGGRRRNDHVTQHIRRNITEFSVAHRKSEDVRGRVLLAIPAVQISHFVIVYNNNAQFGVSVTQGV